MKKAITLCFLVTTLCLQAQHNWSIRASGDVGGNVYSSLSNFPTPYSPTWSSNFSLEMENHRSKRWSLLYGLSLFVATEKSKDTIHFIGPDIYDSGWGLFKVGSGRITPNFGLRYVFIKSSNQEFYGKLKYGIASTLYRNEKFEGVIEGKDHKSSRTSWIGEEGISLEHYCQLGLGYKTKLSKGASPRGFYLSAEANLHFFNDVTSQGYFSTTALFLHGGLGLSYRF